MIPHLRPILILRVKRKSFVHQTWPSSAEECQDKGLGMSWRWGRIQIMRVWGAKIFRVKGKLRDQLVAGETEESAQVTHNKQKEQL